jgi:dTDP-4-amino-4,6-dideoxygalactose transaminase
LLTAGRGGAIVSRHADVLQRAKIFCERGNDAYPLSELQASVLLPQMETLAARHEERKQAVADLRAALSEETSLCMIGAANPDDSPAYYKLAWNLATDTEGPTREAFIAAAQAEGVAIDAGFRGMMHRPRSRCRKVGELANASEASEQTVLLHHPALLGGAAITARVAAAIRKVIRGLASEGGAP